MAEVPEPPRTSSRRQSPTRRQVLIGGTGAAMTAAGAAAAANAAGVVGTAAGAVDAAQASEAGQAHAEPETTMPGREQVPAVGVHQAGIETPPQAHGAFIGLNLKSGVARGDLASLMRIWSNNIERLTAGKGALADTEPELAAVPARLTITIGFGPGIFDMKGLQDQKPTWLQPLPDFKIDRLQARLSGGDLLLQICADDPITVTHSLRMMTKDAARFARVAWVQRGFHHAAAHTKPGTTGRNLMGQIDGTVNPSANTAEFDASVWVNSGPNWIRGGTGMVLRRIRMDLDGWDKLGRNEREEAMGRRLDTGAPLTGELESDIPDFTAKHPNGLDVIPEFAHIRAAAGAESKARFLRRPYNYDDGVLPNGNSDVGLLFAAYAADITEQILPVQKRLAKQDLMNQWTTPIGSAVFALPHGFEPGGFIASDLLA